MEPWNNHDLPRLWKRFGIGTRWYPGRTQLQRNSFDAPECGIACPSYHIPRGGLLLSKYVFKTAASNCEGECDGKLSTTDMAGIRDPFQNIFCRQYSWQPKANTHGWPLSVYSSSALSGHLKVLFKRGTLQFSCVTFFVSRKNTP